jgi:Domain of unknown function (DUF397)
MPGLCIEGTTMLLSDDERERLNWRKAKRSMNNGNCAEVATEVGVVAVRDSKTLTVRFCSTQPLRGVLLPARPGMERLTLSLIRPAFRVPYPGLLWGNRGCRRQ